MTWRLARSLETLRAEVNAFAPNRSKVSDGTLGDPAHASRASRHNPNRYGVVTALDLTHDPAGGFDAHGFARRHVHDPHPELAYVISNREVAKRSTGFRWEPYTGTNTHEKHAHFGVGVGPDSDPLPPYDSRLPWGVSLAAPLITPPEDDMFSDDDRRIQRRIHDALGLAGKDDSFPGKQNISGRVAALYLDMKAGAAGEDVDLDELVAAIQSLPAKTVAALKAAL